MEVSFACGILGNMKKQTQRNDVALVLGGSAGQGLQTIESVISKMFHRTGYCVFSTSEYMSRVRGGSNSTLIRISTERPKQALCDAMDVVFVLDTDAYEYLAPRFGEETIVIADTACEKLPKIERGKVVFVELQQAAEEAGGKILMNTVAAGAILALFGIDDADFRHDLEKVFAKKGEDVVAQNIEAAKRGRALGERIAKEAAFSFEISSKKSGEEQLFLDGSRAVALGAVSGGCDFVSSYPMSPSTGVLVAMADLSQDLRIAVEQVEDEITAANMAVGAWFAGARALVTTSGGGFALMAETMSLAGMTENPLVIHLAQRPGPATGLPTRTEQGDLNFALFIGHGEFPRAVLSPGDAEEAFAAAKHAFDMADKFQVPAIILTDQYLLDSHWESRVSVFDVSEKPQKHFIETDAEYKRYAFTDDGLSPRGIPGFGEGLVRADSDEHDESGHIIEDAETRNTMMEKRMHRLELLREEALSPVYRGPEKPAFLVVGWGSTKGAIEEALETIGNKHIAHLHIRQIFPLGTEILDRVSRAQKVIVVENNFVGQAADLLEKHAGRKVDFRITKYDGRPFSAESLAREISEIVE